MTMDILEIWLKNHILEKINESDQIYHRYLNEYYTSEDTLNIPQHIYEWFKVTTYCFELFKSFGYCCLEYNGEYYWGRTHNNQYLIDDFKYDDRLERAVICDSE